MTSGSARTAGALVSLRSRAASAEPSFVGAGPFFVEHRDRNSARAATAAPAGSPLTAIRDGRPARSGPGFWLSARRRTRSPRRIATNGAIVRRSCNLVTGRACSATFPQVRVCLQRRHCPLHLPALRQPLHRPSRRASALRPWPLAQVPQTRWAQSDLRVLRLPHSRQRRFRLDRHCKN